MHLHPLNKENAKQVARTLFLMGRHHAAINVYDQVRTPRVCLVNIVAD